MTLKRMVGIDEWGEEPIYIMHIPIGARMGRPQKGKIIIMEPNGGLDSNSEPPEFAQYSTAVIVRSVLGVSFFSPKTVGG
jgi:hypothetical protein